MIYKFQPFSVTKELGKEYNAHCSLVPNADDWILILDHDAMIMCAETYATIEKAIARYPDTAIFGAYTNRIGYPFQRMSLCMCEEKDIKVHHRIAKSQAINFADGECEPAHTLAGFFLLFRKSYWERSPFQRDIIDETGTFFDFNFCRLAAQERLPMRIIKGAYLFHWYRFHKASHKDKSHLKLHI